MGVTPLVILVLGILNFRRDKMRQAKAALQAVGAVVIWAILTFTIVMIFFMMAFSFPTYQSQTNELISTVIFICASVFYALVGAALIYWTKRQKKRLPGMGVSC